MEEIWNSMDSVIGMFGTVSELLNDQPGSVCFFLAAIGLYPYLHLHSNQFGRCILHLCPSFLSRTSDGVSNHTINMFHNHELRTRHDTTHWNFILLIRYQIQAIKASAYCLSRSNTHPSSAVCIPRSMANQLKLACKHQPSGRSLAALFLKVIEIIFFGSYIGIKGEQCCTPISSNCSIGKDCCSFLWWSYEWGDKCWLRT
jgi:hypothetical protein